MTDARTVDDLGKCPLWLESVVCADRYQTGYGVNGDSESAWFCRDCGTEIADPDDGCEHCGFGVLTALDSAPSTFLDAEEDHRTC